MARRMAFDTLFEGELPLRRCPEEDVPVHLTRACDASMWQGLITSPDSTVRHKSASLHTRPRIALLDDLPQSTGATRSGGGLPPAVTRRVREYVDSHLDENIGLQVLAGTAGLSVHHFARAFRQSVGEPAA